MSPVLSILLTVSLINYVKSYSNLTITSIVRDTSDVINLDTAFGPGTNGCASIDAQVLPSGKGCRCNQGGTYYTANSGETKCYQDIGQSVGMFNIALLVQLTSIKLRKMTLIL